MDPISASCYTLSANRISRQLSTQQFATLQTPAENFLQTLGSTITVSKYEERNFRNLIPQLLAAVLVTSYHISIGISLAFSAILLPQLKESGELELTEGQSSWIASIIALSNPIGSLLAGALMDKWGRLPTLALAAIPGITGCVTCALAGNVLTLILGRSLIGLANGVGSTPAIVYLTEIARKDMRGSLISFAPALTSLGMVLTFIMGWFMDWRMVAWLTNIFILLPCMVVFFVPESPVWLVSEHRFEAAKKSLNWIYKYQPQPEGRKETIADIQMAILQHEYEMKLIEASNAESTQPSKIQEFLKPTCYKPVLILCGAFFFQQFSGFFVFLFYSIIFFQDVGATINPYLCSIFIGVLRFIMSMVNTYLLRTYKRRPLVMLSLSGMSVFIFLSAFSTYLIQNQITNQSWLPVLFLLLFVAAGNLGIISIPFTMSAEVFPLEIRGVASSCCLIMANVLMFLAIQLHPFIYKALNGMFGTQIYFGTICLVGVVFIYVFLPETYNKKLTEIEDYFKVNNIYLRTKKRSSSKIKAREPVRNIVKRQVELEESLLEEV